MEQKLCKCGCGISIPFYDKKNRERFYILGHRNRGKIFESMRVPKNYICSYCNKTFVRYTKPSRVKKFKHLFCSIKHRSKFVNTNGADWLVGDKNPNWKGGITPINTKIRHSLEYKNWRREIFSRDHYTCVWCGNNKSGNLNADHIKAFAYFPELRFAIDNGRTLCRECHKTTDTYLKKLKTPYYATN